MGKETKIEGAKDKMKINEYGRRCLVFGLRDLLERAKNRKKVPVSYTDNCVKIEIKYKKEALNKRRERKNIKEVEKNKWQKR